MSWPRHTSFRRDFSRTVRGFRICLAAHFADPFAAAVSRQRRGGRRRRQTMDFAAHVRGLAGATGSAVSSIGFPRAAEMIKNDSDRRCARISVQSAIASLICEINENDFCRQRVIRGRSLLRDYKCTFCLQRGVRCGPSLMLMLHQNCLASRSLYGDWYLIELRSSTLFARVDMRYQGWRYWYLLVSIIYIRSANYFRIMMQLPIISTESLKNFSYHQSYALHFNILGHVWNNPFKRSNLNHSRHMLLNNPLGKVEHELILS